MNKRRVRPKAFDTCDPSPVLNRLQHEKHSGCVEEQTEQTQTKLKSEAYQKVAQQIAVATHQLHSRGLQQIGEHQIKQKLYKQFPEHKDLVCFLVPSLLYIFDVCLYSNNLERKHDKTMVNRPTKKQKHRNLKVHPLSNKQTEKPSKKKKKRKPLVYYLRCLCCCRTR